MMCLLPVSAKQTKTVRMKVIETSDVHGHFFPYDFMERRPLKGTLARANTYINKERATYGDHLLLIDNGDILQGQPCIYWSNYVMPQVAIRSMTNGSVRCAVRCWEPTL